MNTDSVQVDLIGSQSERRALSEAVPEADQSRQRDKTSDPWPGVAPPAGWFLRAARVTAASQGQVSVSSSADREPGEPRIETGPGTQAPAPGPADPSRPPVIPAPRRSPETSVWLHAYHLWTESGIPWQQAPSAPPRPVTPPRPVAPPRLVAVPPRPPAPAPAPPANVSIAQSSPLERVDRAIEPAAATADRDKARTSYTARHARTKSAKQPRAPQPEPIPAPMAARPRPRQVSTELPAFAAAQFLGAPVQLSARDQGPRDQGVRDLGPGDLSPRSQGPRDQGVRRPGGILLLDRPPVAPPLAIPIPPDDGDEPPLDPESFRPRIMFGRRVLALGVPVLVLTMVAAAAVALLTGHGPAANRATAPRQAAIQTELPGYPGLGGRGTFESANRIVTYGGTAVVTAQVGTEQRFFVSADGGTTWHPAQVPAGAAAGHVAPLLAGGPDGWVAIGSQAIWTSKSGASWTLRSAHGISDVPGDQVSVLTATSAGFLAGGTSASGQAVVWTSPDAVTWHRSTPPLDVTSVLYATARGTQTLIAGVRQDGTSAAWLSTDGGATWAEVTIPQTHGATGTIAGLAADPAGLLAVRDGSSGDAITYFSHNGRTWLYAGTLGASGGLRPRVVKGNGYGLVVAGQDSTGQLVAYRDADIPQQATWRPTAILGYAAAEAVVGAAVAPGDSVIAIGATAATPVAQQPVFIRATASSVTPVELPAEAPELTVSAVTRTGGVEIAVGSANGYPAIWRRALVSGHWSPWSLVTSPAQFGPQALGAFTSITHGPSSWLAVGHSGGGSITMTSPDGVTWHVA